MNEEVINKIAEACANAVRSVLSVAVTATETAAEPPAPVEAEPAPAETDEVIEGVAVEDTPTPKSMDDELTDAEAADIKSRIEAAMKILAEREAAKGGN